jgi:hypothetical protein
MGGGAAFGVGVYDAISQSAVNALYYVSSPNVTLDYSWESPFVDSQITCCDYNFNISVRTSTGYLSATGSLSPTSITASGPFSACSIMRMDQVALININDPVNSVLSSMPGSAVCPPNESIVKSQMQNNTCPSIKWQEENGFGEWLFHNPNLPFGPSFHVYKEAQSAQHWGAECAYYPDTKLLVPNDVPGHGTADYWPDSDWMDHVFFDPGGPRLLGRIPYHLYWLMNPLPPGMQ